MPDPITWNEARTRAVTPAGHRVFILRNKETKTRVVQVIYPKGGRITERFVAAEDDATACSEAERLVAEPYRA